MSVHQDLFFPAVEAIATNGKSITGGPLFQDLNSNFFIAVIPKTWTDENGVNHYVFELWYQETQKINYTTFLFPRSSSQDVDSFLTVVNAQALNNNLTQYNGWVAINRRDIGAARNILLNDSFIERRIYRQSHNVTDLYVGIRQALDQEIFTVTGNQEKAFAYYYAYGS